MNPIEQMQNIILEQKKRIVELEAELAIERGYRVADNEAVARWQERVRVLTEALRPFAAEASELTDADLDDYTGWLAFRVKDIRAAAAAMEGK